VLFGALVGAAGGAAVGANADPSKYDYYFERGGMVLLGTGVGAGLGSLAGVIVAVSRN
jgi:hypothetical protein